MWIVLTLKSTPMVAACSGSKASSVNLKSSEDLPTLLSPMISSFNVVSNWSTSMIKFAKLRTFTWNFGAELWDFVFVLVSQKCQKIKWRKRLNSLPIAETALFRTVADWHMALKYWWDESQFLRHTKSVGWFLYVNVWWYTKYWFRYQNCEHYFIWHFMIIDTKSPLKTLWTI